jgi:hypothetical protein
MARIRTIKPDFFRSDDVAGLSYRARLTWIGLWTYVDDEGRGKDNPRIIKGDLWPLEDDVTHEDVEADLRELAVANRITRYVAEGERCLLVRKWDSHQRISKPSPSKLPEPPANDAEDSATIPGGVPEDSANTIGPLPVGKERNREQGSGREGNTPSPAARSRMFDQFWDEYPRKVGKDDARRAYKRACSRTDEQTIVQGARRLANDPNLPEKQYVPHPATWLNRGGWDDEPLPPRGQESAADQRFNRNLQLVQELQGFGELERGHGTA